eukprot:scaffold693_cov399-Prasinococcus_capsulatus_cf.AAC.24
MQPSRFKNPVRDGFVSSPFGIRWGAKHEGVDIAADIGTPITAAEGGVVTRSGWFRGYGRLIEIEHASGFSTRYGHCHSLVARPGQVRDTGLCAFLVELPTLVGGKEGSDDWNCGQHRPLDWPSSALGGAQARCRTRPTDLHQFIGSAARLSYAFLGVWRNDIDARSRYLHVVAVLCPIPLAHSSRCSGHHYSPSDSRYYTVHTGIGYLFSDCHAYAVHKIRQIAA